MIIDYLVVGSGLTGAVVARLLADAGRDVLVVDRRGHVGGNVHDHAHESGIRVHTYGPHYFRTSSDRIWDFATRFSPFYHYEARLVSDVGGEFLQWPVAGSYIRRVAGDDWRPEFIGAPTNFEEAALAIMPRVIYERFVKEYNEKQWGVAAASLSKDLCGRFDVRYDDDPRLKPCVRYQGIPKLGYAGWMGQILSGIPVLLNYDYLKRKNDIRPSRALVFTGPIDEFYGYDLGKLAYRGQRRTTAYRGDVDGFLLSTGQVNNPLHAGGPHIRTLEWKHMMEPESGSRIRGTVLTQETPYTPSDPGEYEYPFPDAANAKLYGQYRLRAGSQAGVVICGRLGEYQYYDMDQAIGRAFVLAERIMK